MNRRAATKESHLPIFTKKNQVKKNHALASLAKFCR